MSSWICLSLYFKNLEKVIKQLSLDAHQNKPVGIYKELISYLKKVVDALSPDLIDRYYYFFEPEPHLFLALELKDRRDIKRAEEIIKGINKPDFVDKIKIALSVSEGGDPQAAIDFFHAGTKFAFLRINDEYVSSYQSNDVAKLVHCFCNQMFVERLPELMFYVKRLQDNSVPIRAEVRDNRIMIALDKKSDLSS